MTLTREESDWRTIKIASVGLLAMYLSTVPSITLLLRNLLESSSGMYVRIIIKLSQRLSDICISLWRGRSLLDLLVHIYRLQKFQLLPNKIPQWSCQILTLMLKIKNGFRPTNS